MVFFVFLNTVSCISCLMVVGATKFDEKSLSGGNAGVILPYDPRLDKVVLVEQIRIPVIETSNTPWLLEAIAGMVEKMNH